MMRLGLFDPKPSRTYSQRRLAAAAAAKKAAAENGDDKKEKEAVSSKGKPTIKTDKETENDGHDEHDLDFAVEKKQYAKEKAPVSRDGSKISGADEDINEAEEEGEGDETETVLNTQRNAMLYHTSEDSIDLYRSENNSLDLLGRLYYDDYDPENRQVVERVASYTSLPAMARSIVSPSGKRPLFARQVSFDTLSDSHHQAITLKVKHPEFKFRRNNKTFLIGFSNDQESMKAVEWAFLEMVISGDTLVVLQVMDEKNHGVLDAAEAQAVVDRLKRLNTHSKRISLVYEVVIGNPQKLLKNAILEYKPAMMIVGTKHYGPATPMASESVGATGNGANGTTNGTGTISGGAPMTPFLSHPQPVRPNTLFPTTLHLSLHLAQSHHSPLHRLIFLKTSTSKYFLQYALVPVILVKPSYTVHETLDRPVDSENYFRDWLANIDVAPSREKKKKHMFGMRSRLNSRLSSRLSSRLGSRLGSHTSLADFMHHDRGSERIHDKLAERLLENPHESRGRSLGEMFLFSGAGSRDSSRSRSRSRPLLSHEDQRDSNLDCTLDSNTRSGSRSRSRSRLSRLFGG